MIKKLCKFTVDEGFGNEFLRTSYVLPQEECEDRSLFSLYTSQMTDETKQKEHILASCRRRGKRQVFWTANPFLAGLQLVYRSCMQLTRRTRNHCYCPSLLAQSSFCIVRRCWKQQIYRNVYDKRQFQVMKFSKKRKNKTSMKGKAFRDFFSLYTLVEICPFNSKGRWTPISLSWLSWFDKIFVFLEKKCKLYRGFSQRSHSRRQG